MEIPCGNVLYNALLAKLIYAYNMCEKPRDSCIELFALCDTKRFTVAVPNSKRSNGITYIYYTRINVTTKSFVNTLAINKHK